jgi:hypothetical protein
MGGGDEDNVINIKKDVSHVKAGANAGYGNWGLKPPPKYIYFFFNNSVIIFSKPP